MISEIVRKGIRLAIIDSNLSIAKACANANCSETSIYRFMRGGGDIYIVKLDKFCRLGLNRTLMEVLELGKS